SGRRSTSVALSWGGVSNLSAVGSRRQADCNGQTCRPRADSLRTASQPAQFGLRPGIGSPCPLDPYCRPAGAGGRKPFPLGGVRPSVWEDGRGNLPDCRSLGVGAQPAFFVGGGNALLHCRWKAGYFSGGLGT